ncbi:MAG TPA: HNH endonuclease [Ignavibacteriaceae bacterium]|nr:HNH endonuclease [Ignavibacteriaceae bacterium]
MTINKSKEVYKDQRSKEKTELFKRFRLLPIEELYKEKFFALFNHRCFKCGVKEKPHPEIGKPAILCIDHHIPMILGGHLVPGNLVALCQRCNNKKKDKPPQEFYTPEELKKLKPILERQSHIFDFNFDWEYWNRDRKGYLLSLGLDPQRVHKMLYNENDRDYLGLATSRYEITLRIDSNEIE